MSNVKVYMEQGGATQVIATGGVIKIAGGAIVPSSGTQASHIADFSSATGAAPLTTGDAAKLNSLLAAVENVGILATS